MIGGAGELGTYLPPPVFNYSTFTTHHPYHSTMTTPLLHSRRHCYGPVTGSGNVMLFTALLEHTHTHRDCFPTKIFVLLCLGGTAGCILSSSVSNDLTPFHRLPLLILLLAPSSALPPLSPSCATALPYRDIKYVAGYTWALRSRPPYLHTPVRLTPTSIPQLYSSSH